MSVRVARAGNHLVYQPLAEGTNESQLVAIDGSGRTEPLIATPGDYGGPQVSPDGRHVAYVDSGNAGDSTTGAGLTTGGAAAGDARIRCSARRRSLIG